MTAEASAAIGFVAAGASTFVLTPGAIRVARRTGFLDRPREYRVHGAPTPFLGGAAVCLGVAIGAVIIDQLSGRLWVALACALAMWGLGTADDRFAVTPRWRLVGGILTAVALSAVGLGWHTDGGQTVDSLLTVLWVVGLVNAFNLMDNMDGACATVASVSAAGIGTLAAIHGQTAAAGLSFALCGSCVAFLRWNLAGPARIFLGDGGSMTIGFLVAALAMTSADHTPAGDGRVLIGGLLVGVAMLDTTLVSVSRLRRGIPLVTGGRDHLTHRVFLALPSSRKVAGALAFLQVGLCVLAIGADALGTAAVIAFALAAVAGGIGTIVVLDTARWRPPGIATGSRQTRRRARSASSVGDSA